MAVKRARVVVVGSSNIDMVVNLHRLPNPGETLIGREFFTTPGGKGANQAVAAARAGADVVFLGCVGDDVLGQQMLQGFEADGIDCRHVRLVDDCASGCALIMVGQDGQNMIAVAPGANARLTPGDILVAAEAMQGADVVLLQLETPVETVTRAVEVARAAGAKVMLNPAPALQGGIPPTLISKVDYLVPNENELALLAGADGEAPKDLAEAAMDMLHLGCRCVLVTRGREGATLVASGRALQMPAPEVDAVDAVAAGDTFCGAFACAIGEGMKEVDAMRFAVAAASLSVTRKGAQASMPRREEIDAALAHV